MSELIARYQAEGEAAFESRSRCPHTSPNAIEADTVELTSGSARTSPSKDWTPTGFAGQRCLARRGSLDLHFVPVVAAVARINDVQALLSMRGFSPVAGPL